MVEIRYGDYREMVDLTGRSVADVRKEFQAKFGISDKAGVKLNDRKIKPGLESETRLRDSDTIRFSEGKTGIGAFLTGALLLALAVTGGVFAFGFINDTATIGVAVTQSNFADVTANNSMSSNAWKVFGFYKGAIPAGTLFIVTPATGYTGDLSVTVSLTNGAALSRVYRVLSLKLGLIYTDNSSAVDINESTDNGSGDANTDYVVLTLDNGGVTMFPQGTASSANMTVVVKEGYFLTHVKPFAGFTATDAEPQLICEVAQRGY